MPDTILEHSHYRLMQPDNKISITIINDMIEDIENDLHEDSHEFIAYIKDIISDWHDSDIGELISNLSKQTQLTFFDCLGHDLPDDIIAYIPEGLHEDILDHLTDQQLTRYLRNMESDDALAIIESIAREDRENIFKLLPDAASSMYRKLLTYPEDSAARIMRRESVVIPEHWIVGDIIDYMRERHSFLPSQFYNIIIVDPSHKPVGLIPLATLMRMERPTKIYDIMDSNALHIIPTDMDQEDVAQLFRKYGLIEVPVTDEFGRFVGVITIDDVVDVIDEEHSEDMLRLAGVGEHNLYADITQMTKARFSWLFINLLTAVLASVAIAIFSDVLAQIVSLAILMPIVASMGGNAATQTMTVTIRAITLNQINRKTLISIFFKESFVGWINGVIFAILSFMMAYVWFEEIFLGIIIGMAMIINLVIAGICGVVIPITLNHMKFDPAVSSSVFVTTITDIVGFGAFLGLASFYIL